MGLGELSCLIRVRVYWLIPTAIKTGESLAAMTFTLKPLATLFQD